MPTHKQLIITLWRKKPDGQQEMEVGIAEKASFIDT